MRELCFLLRFRFGIRLGWDNKDRPPEVLDRDRKEPDGFDGSLLERGKCLLLGLLLLGNTNAADTELASSSTRKKISHTISSFHDKVTMFDLKCCAIVGKGKDCIYHQLFRSQQSNRRKTHKHTPKQKKWSIDLKQQKKTQGSHRYRVGEQQRVSFVFFKQSTLSLLLLVEYFRLYKIYH